MTARVLDDGSTQVYRKTYNVNGYVTQSIDPTGRETDNTYDANNNIDLLTTAQKNVSVRGTRLEERHQTPAE
jgi:hypothetical protein